MPPTDSLDPALQLALAWHPADTRPALEALFALDTRLGGIVARSREPMLAQIKLAWWRERLAESQDARLGEPLLAALAQTWGGQAASLQALVDGWEAQLADPPDRAALGEGRASALQAFARLVDADESAQAASAVGHLWSRAQWGSGEQDPLSTPPIASRKLRGVAVLGGLAARAIARRAPLEVNRAAVLRAWRLGLFGR